MTRATYSERQFLDFADKYTTENGRPPTIDHIVEKLGGSKPTAMRHRHVWEAARVKPPVDIPTEVITALSAAIRAAEDARDATFRERETVHNTDLVALGNSLEAAESATAKLSSDLAERTTERDRLLERADNLAQERTRLSDALEEARRNTAQAEAKLDERTAELNRLRGEVDALRQQLAATAAERDTAQSRAATLATFVGNSADVPASMAPESTTPSTTAKRKPSK